MVMNCGLTGALLVCFRWNLSCLVLEHLVRCLWYKSFLLVYQIDKVDAFLKACKQFGMDEKDLFVTLDLVEYQNKNMVSCHGEK